MRRTTTNNNHNNNNNNNRMAMMYKIKILCLIFKEMLVEERKYPEQMKS